MNSKSITSTLATGLLFLTSLASASVLTNSLPGQTAEPEKTLKGSVTDSKCKGRIDRKAVTRYSCTLKCVHEEGAGYALVVGDAVYALQGHEADLDKFAGGPATVTGQVNGSNVLVEAVAK